MDEKSDHMIAAEKSAQEIVDKYGMPKVKENVLLGLQEAFLDGVIWRVKGELSDLKELQEKMEAVADAQR